MRRHLRFFAESSVNTFSGMLGSYVITIVTMTYVHDPAKAAAITVSLCTVWSLIRGYFWRLWIARRADSRSNEMNIWHPAKNEAEATAWFRVTNPTGVDWTVAALVRTGWTIPAAVQYGYIELMPGAPEHLRMPPMMPAAPATPNAWHLTRPTTPSKVAQEVVCQVLDRDAHGQKKYGVTLDRDDLSLSDWLQHMAEELMDGAHYALAAKRVQQGIIERNNADFLALLERCCVEESKNADSTCGITSAWKVRDRVKQQLVGGTYYALAAKRVRDQYEVEVLQLVANAAMSMRNPYIGGIADREIAFSQGVTALLNAIKQELSK